jgi:hypothetical protein
VVSFLVRQPAVVAYCVIVLLINMALGDSGLGAVGHECFLFLVSFDPRMAAAASNRATTSSSSSCVLFGPGLLEDLGLAAAAAHEEELLLVLLEDLHKHSG